MDVTGKDSPYGLITDVLTNLQTPRPVKSANNLGGLSPREVWFADGDMLVLKGGMTDFDASPTFENSWPPIDNYEAPYKEPVFPPDHNYDLEQTEKSPSRLTELNKFPRDTQFPSHPTSTTKHVSNPTRNQDFKSWPQFSSAPLRVETSDFRPSLKLTSSQPSGFHPLSAGRYVGQTGAIAVQTPVVSLFFHFRTR